MGQTLRQRILAKAYPVLMKLTRLTRKNVTVKMNKSNIPPSETIYSKTIDLIGGASYPLTGAKGKKILIVNTASNCGYTAQYEDLQKLQDKYANAVVVIGFPANDFKEQEKDDDDIIGQFCKRAFGVHFPLAKKSTVIKGAAQHEVWSWLTDPEKNGWNDQAPEWNFSKYLINEQGQLTHYFGPSISPLDSQIVDAIDSKE